MSTCFWTDQVGCIEACPPLPFGGMFRQPVTSAFNLGESPASYGMQLVNYVTGNEYFVSPAVLTPYLPNSGACPPAANKYTGASDLVIKAISIVFFKAQGGSLPLFTFSMPDFLNGIYIPTNNGSQLPCFVADTYDYGHVISATTTPLVSVELDSCNIVFQNTGAYSDGAVDWGGSAPYGGMPQADFMTALGVSPSDAALVDSHTTCLANFIAELDGLYYYCYGSFGGYA